jgi:hypothetical protein
VHYQRRRRGFACFSDPREPLSPDYLNKLSQLSSPERYNFKIGPFLVVPDNVQDLFSVDPDIQAVPLINFSNPGGPIADSLGRLGKFLKWRSVAQAHSPNFAQRSRFSPVPFHSPPARKMRSADFRMAATRECLVTLSIFRPRSSIIAHKQSAAFAGFCGSPLPSRCCRQASQKINARSSSGWKLKRAHFFERSSSGFQAQKTTWKRCIVRRRSRTSADFISKTSLGCEIPKFVIRPPLLLVSEARSYSTRRYRRRMPWELCQR